MTAREKETIITIMVGCIALYGIFAFQWLWIAALAIGLTGMFSDKLTKWIHAGWFWLARMLGFVTSKAILGLLFLVILLPLALMAKLFRRDFMLLRNRYPSYFVERSHVYEMKDLENPW